MQFQVIFLASLNGVYFLYYKNLHNLMQIT